MNKTALNLAVLTFLLVFFSTAAIKAAETDLEFKVQEGDTKTFKCTKYSFNDKSEGTLPLEGENGSFVNVIRKKGVKVKVEIIEVSASTVTYQETWDGVKLKKQVSNNEATPWFVMTTDNREIWEDLVVERTYERDENYWIKWEISGDAVSTELYQYISSEVNEIELTVESEFNWKTGWFTYKYSMERQNDLVSEIEWTSDGSGIPGFQAFPVVSVLTVIALVSIKCKKRK